jgi:hypothetical protein
MNRVLGAFGALTYFLGYMGTGKTLKKGAMLPRRVFYTASKRDSKASADPNYVQEDPRNLLTMLHNKILIKTIAAYLVVNVQRLTARIIETGSFGEQVIEVC